MAFLARMLTRRCFSNPIFIVGSGRSGTSVLLQALGKHPRIFAMPGEAPLLTSLGSIPYLFDLGDQKDYYLASLKGSKERLYSRLQDLCFEISAGPDWGLKKLLREAIQDRVLPWKKQYWCAKTFPTYRVTEGLLKLYPRTRFIYMLRNGIDVVQSMTKYSGFRERDFVADCKHWSGEVEKYKYFIDLPAAVTVRHEDMVTEPGQVFQKIFSFLGIENHPASLSFVQTNLVHPLDMPDQNVAEVRKVFSSREPGYVQWTCEQKNTFKTICSEAMRGAGYEVPF
jgi:hypothetical protein